MTTERPSLVELIMQLHGALAAGATDRTFARHDYRIPVIAADDLAVLKVMFDRPKDWLDLAAMLEARTVAPDAVARWLERILGPEHPSLARWQALAATEPDAPGAEMDAPSPWLGKEEG